MCTGNDFYWRGIINFQRCTAYFRPIKAKEIDDHSFEIIFSNAKIVSQFAGRKTTIYRPKKDNIFKERKIFDNDTNIKNQYKQFQKYVYEDVERFFQNIEHGLCRGDKALKNQKDMEKIIYE